MEVKSGFHLKYHKMNSYVLPDNVRAVLLVVLHHKAQELLVENIHASAVLDRLGVSNTFTLYPVKSRV